MDRPELELAVAPALRLFLAPRHRDGLVRVRCDGTSTLGHLVESLGVPLPEVGRLVVDGQPVAPGYRPAGGERAAAEAVARPQRLPAARFLLDVHLGALARRMRLVGLDADYANDRDDDELIARANATGRVLLTRDRGLLRRRALWLGAYVRGDRPDDQLADVVGRFDPPLAPWTRCTLCNGPLGQVRKGEVERELRPGTRRTYADFARCGDCGRIYWRGAHAARLTRIVDRAVARGTAADPVTTRGSANPPG